VIPNEVQHTLHDALEFEGVGLHSGVVGHVSVQPQPADSGLSFRLGAGAPVLAAVAENVVETRRATVLGDGRRTVSTVEHLLSALFGMGVDNALIEVEGPEIPAMDGSAAEFVRAIESVGLASQAGARVRFIAERPYFKRDGEALIVILPAAEFRVKFSVDYPAPIGSQYFDGAIDATLYRDDIAPARTFGYLQEYQALLERGLARGGTLGNALVFTEEGPLTKLRWPNEVVRHKVLDLIGDIALLGAWPQCEIVAVKTGHRLHAAAVCELRAALGPRLGARAGAPA